MGHIMVIGIQPFSYRLFAFIAKIAYRDAAELVAKSDHGLHEKALLNHPIGGGHSQQANEFGKESHRPSQVLVLRTFRTYFLSAPLMLIAFCIQGSH